MVNYFSKKNKRVTKKVYKQSQIKKARKYRIRMKRKSLDSSYYKRRFRQIAKEIHSKIIYDSGETIIAINTEFGLEDIRYRDYFFNISKKILNSRKNHLILDIRKCERIWPSAITFLCSLKQWAEINNKYSSSLLNIASTDSSFENVNIYLNKCGFYRYVGRKGNLHFQNQISNDILKIQREKDKHLVEIREDEIIALLRQYTMFTEDQLELFNSIILTETFNNVLEHGIVNKDEGWWVLAQVHKHHGFISLCIADNGIGFVNTLQNGPQSKDIKALNLPEGDLIKYAFKENVSGASNATPTTKKSKANRGARRGNGLGRIKDTCKNLEMEFSIISHKGYCNVDINENITTKTFDEIIFGGTMYSFIIPMNRRPAWQI